MVKLFLFCIILFLLIKLKSFQKTVDTLVMTQAHLIKQISDFDNKIVDSRSQVIITYYLKNLKANHVLASQNPVHYVENPISAYTLITRLSRDLWAIEDILNNTGLYNRNETLYYPSQRDLNDAIVGVHKIQQVYNYDITLLANGTLVSKFSKSSLPYVEYTSPMTALDCFYLGMKFEEFQGALIWLIEAHRRYDPFEVYFQLSEFQLIDEITQRYNTIGDYKNAIYWLKKRLNIKPDAKGMYLLKEALRRLKRNVPVKFTKQENKNPDFPEFWKTCRGERKTVFKNASLTCHYTHGPHPFLVLAPVKAEVLHRDPDVIMYYDVISDEKIEDLIRLASMKIQMNLKSDRNLITGGEFRPVHTNTFRADDSYPETAVISRIVHILTGSILSSKLGGFGSSQKYAEILQVVKYGHIGSYIGPHFDTSDCNQYYTDKGHTTVFFYLTATEQGGATVFPRIGLRIYPVKNAALFWMNVDEWGRKKSDLYHGGCPVIRGSKWIASKWIHGKGQLYTCPTYPPKSK